MWRILSPSLTSLLRPLSRVLNQRFLHNSAKPEVGGSAFLACALFWLDMRSLSRAVSALSLRSRIPTTAVMRRNTRQLMRHEMTVA